MEAAPLAVVPPSASVAVQKRYESLLTVRAKAMRGKGAWFWAHLQPILVHTPEAQAVKLRCSLCDAVFSASNPSRTATEHLKRGSCPNFSSLPLQIDCLPMPIASLAPSEAKESVKKLKVSPAVLSEAQAECAVSVLYEWLYYFVGSGGVSLSSLQHPKFQSFLAQIGMRSISCRQLLGQRLDLCYKQAREEADARIGDALFFQISSSGWNGQLACVIFVVNLPNGTAVAHRSVCACGGAPSGYAEEAMWSVVKDVCSRSNVRRCAGIVADRFKSKALRELEQRNHWMVNVSCQLDEFSGLVKYLCSELPLFQSVVANCCKLARYFNSHSKVRNAFNKYQLQEHGNARLLTVARLQDGTSGTKKAVDSEPVIEMIEDVLCYSQAIQLAVLDEEYKSVCFEDPSARDLAEMIRDMSFWNDVDAVISFVNLIKEMVDNLETERPLVGQCLLLWEELRSKVKECCSKFNIDESPVMKVIEKRFRKNYHPVWSAAFVLDPLYLVKDSSGKYLPPFKCLTPDQEKDVDKLITRLVSPDEAHIALMELMKWRTQGLDPLYAQAVQMKELDKTTGKMRIANPQSSRLVWETCLNEFNCLAKIAVRLIFLHATSFNLKCSPAFLRRVSGYGSSKASVDRAEKLVFLAAQAKLERRDFSSEEERDIEMFADCEDDLLHDNSFPKAQSV